MKQRGIEERVFNIISHFSSAVIALLCVLPFIMVISGSFSNEKEILSGGYGLLPKGFSIEAYRTVLIDPTQVLRSYMITIFITLAGTLVGLFLTAMTAYVLYRRDFRYRNQFSFFFYFTTLFSGGLVSYYIIMLNVFHLKNSILALILPLLMSPYYILIMRNFLKSVPDAIPESAKVDGAGDFTIYIKLCLPLMKPALASIGMFIALNYWNDWFQAMLFIQSRTLFPMQYSLYRMITNIEFLSYMAGENGIPTIDLPKETVKLAMTVIAVGPIILLFPFIQKYFIKGLTIGAVKG